MDGNKLTKIKMDKKIIEAHGRIIYEFEVLHTAWELDYKGWIVESGKDRKIILTNHGVTYVAKKSDLKKKIQEYSEAIKETEEALKLLK